MNTFHRITNNMSRSNSSSSRISLLNDEDSNDHMDYDDISEVDGFNLIVPTLVESVCPLDIHNNDYLPPPFYLTDKKLTYNNVEINLNDSRDDQHKSEVSVPKYNEHKNETQEGDASLHATTVAPNEVKSDHKLGHYCVDVLRTINQDAIEVKQQDNSTSPNVIDSFLQKSPSCSKTWNNRNDTINPLDVLEEFKNAVEPTVGDPNIIEDDLSFLPEEVHSSILEKLSDISVNSPSNICFSNCGNVSQSHSTHAKSDRPIVETVRSNLSVCCNRDDYQCLQGDSSEATTYFSPEFGTESREIEFDCFETSIGPFVSKKKNESVNEVKITRSNQYNPCNLKYPAPSSPSVSKSSNCPEVDYSPQILVGKERETARRQRFVALLCFMVYLPILFLGPKLIISAISSTKVNELLVNEGGFLPIVHPEVIVWPNQSEIESGACFGATYSVDNNIGMLYGNESTALLLAQCETNDRMYTNNSSLKQTFPFDIEPTKMILDNKPKEIQKQWDGFFRGLATMYRMAHTVLKISFVTMISLMVAKLGVLKQVQQVMLETKAIPNMSSPSNDVCCSTYLDYNLTQFPDLIRFHVHGNRSLTRKGRKTPTKMIGNGRRISRNDMELIVNGFGTVNVAAYNKLTKDEMYLLLRWFQFQTNSLKKNSKKCFILHMLVHEYYNTLGNLSISQLKLLLQVKNIHDDEWWKNRTKAMKRSELIRTVLEIGF